MTRQLVGKKRSSFTGPFFLDLPERPPPRHSPPRDVRSPTMSHLAMCPGLGAELTGAQTSGLSSRRATSVAGSVNIGSPHASRISSRLRHTRRCPMRTRAELPSLIPADSADALGRFRKVMVFLYAAGGALHFPDLFGAGPISSACGVVSFSELNPWLQAVTLGWAVCGPVASVGLATNKTWGDILVVAVASTEVVLGIDFTAEMAPSPIPVPVVAAQVVSLMSVFAIYVWRKTEKAEEAR